MKYSLQTLSSSFFRFTKGKSGEELENSIKAFAAFLKKKSPAVNPRSLLKKMKIDESSVSEQAILFSADQVSEELIERVKKNFNLEGEVKVVIDSSLVAGLMLRYRGVLYDATAKNFLARAKAAITV